MTNEQMEQYIRYPVPFLGYKMKILIGFLIAISLTWAVHLTYLHTDHTTPYNIHTISSTLDDILNGQILIFPNF